MIALDCTVRDGGYYNKWQFTIELVNNYLSVMETSQINAVEIGFRSAATKQLGKFTEVTDVFIEENLYIPNIDYFGVMINTSEFINTPIKKLFSYEDLSPINLVRVATHFKDINLAESICKDLKSLGYTVCCNLMQAADKSFDEIATAAETIEGWQVVDVLYIADSLGGMNHDSVNYAYKALRSCWSGQTGFHGHNNKGQALDNSLEAVDIGVDWIDCTILGMGRGPGNTETEYLLSELNNRGFGEFGLEGIYNLVLKDFTTLKQRYEWGPSLLYYLAAEYSIHPIYIQNMQTAGYSSLTTLHAINYLKDKDTNSFNNNLYKEALKSCV